MSENMNRPRLFFSASATVETNTITIDPDRLLDLKPGESYGPPDEYAVLDFPINPERVAPVLRRLISPTKTRARIYDRDGVLILDSRSLYGRGDVLRFELPPPAAEKPGIVERAMIAIRTSCPMITGSSAALLTRKVTPHAASAPSASPRRAATAAGAHDTAGDRGEKKCENGLAVSKGAVAFSLTTFYRYARRRAFFSPHSIMERGLFIS